jgi:hypothetical protein
METYLAATYTLPVKQLIPEFRHPTVGLDETSKPIAVPVTSVNPPIVLYIKDC